MQAKSKMKPTLQQQFFLDAVRSTTSNIALVARAGCGKTSTILMAVEVIAEAFPTAEVTVCAYNKAIADEIKEKLVKAGYSDWKRYQASTIHSMGFGLLKFVFKIDPKTGIDATKVRKIIRSLAERKAHELDREYGKDYVSRPKNYAYEYGSQIEKLVACAKQAAVGFFDDQPVSDVKVWADLANHFDINGFDHSTDMDVVIALAQEVYHISLIDTKVIDYDDMILFPLIKNIRVRFTRDFIFLDEAQDLSRARQALAKKFLGPHGRMFIIGDDRQAIYGFSGADAEALDNLSNSLNAVRMPLSVTWRCPKLVVAEAQKIVPDIQAADSAPDGEVLDASELPDDLAAGDAVLCRKTAPLITLAYSLIRQGRAVKVEGRSIGEGLIALTNRWKLTTIDAFLKRLEDYRGREVQKAQAQDKDQKVEEINDRCDTLVEICNVCIKRKYTTLQSVREFIGDMFADGVTDCVVLATYHRSKGREWGRVFLWDHDRCCPSPYAKQPWQKRQEQNLAYVAITRAMKSLTFVTPIQEKEGQ